MGTDLELALGAADLADGITFSAFRRPSLTVETKPDQTPVSEADRAAEIAIRQLLESERPADAVLGEETGSSGSGARRWVIDPIDGTVNFVRGIPVWATLIGLEVSSVLQVGVVSAPALGRRWWARRGEGAYAGQPGQAGEQIRVSDVRTLAEAAISSGSMGDFPVPKALLELTARVARDRGFGDFWSHMLVAEGACEVGLDPVVSLWDIAALQVIVEEAGGKFTDFSGHARLDGGSAVSSNGLVHDDVISLLSGSPGPSGPPRSS
jgi:histidinol-phosphatase